MDGLEIRPIRGGDLAMLREYFDEGTPEQPEQGLARQREGRGEFVIAFLHGVPVGYLALYWDAEPHAPPEWQGTVPNLSGFVVQEQYRSMGIGTEMMRVAEHLASEAGFSLLGLGVGVDNHRARSLYERLGYADAGLPEVTDSGSFRRWDGTVHEWRETWCFMVKGLHADQADER
jgi:ribosomal protein S18 acetylase RimI-like enzyme